MNKFKNLLQYDASKFIFVATSVLFFILSKTSYIAILLLVILLFFLIKKSKNLLLYSLIFIIAITIRIDSIDNKYNSNELPTKGEVTNVYEDYFILKSKSNYLVYFNHTQDLKPGMQIELTAYEVDIKERNIMHNFSYTLYLKTRNISKVLKTSNVVITKETFNINIIKFNVIRYIDKTYTSSQAQYIKLFFLGEKAGVDKEMLDKSSKLGISHLFAISGMHIALFVSFINIILNRFYLKKSTHKKVIFVFLVTYNILTGFKISIIRASLLIITIYIKDFFKILLTRTDLLSFSFLGFLIYNPYLLYDVGFQLSYLLSFAIIMGNSIINNSSYLKRIFFLSVYASLVSLPIILELNKTYGLFNIFANIFFVVFVSLVFLPATLFVLVFPILGTIYDKLIIFFINSIDFISENNIFINVNFSNNIYKVIYWAMLFIVFIAIQKRKRIVEFTFLLSVSLLTCFLFPLPPLVDYIRILDVNQGDAIHFHSQSCDMLMDTGEEDKYESIENYFNGYEIKDLDIVLITHFHDDHYGELRKLSDKITINNLFVNNDIASFTNYQVIKKYDRFSCGNYQFYVLSANTGSSNENNNSIVIYMEAGKDKWLFTGDIEKEVERSIIEEYKLNIDILKVPHHGSKTSSTLDFLRQLSPSVAILSVGENNKYNLPDWEIVNRYNKNNIEIYRTDEKGTITFYYVENTNIRLIESFKFDNKKKYSFQIN